MAKTALHYLIGIVFVISSCNNTQQTPAISVGKDSTATATTKTVIKQTPQKVIKQTIAANTVLIDTAFDNYALKLSYLKDAPSKQDSFAFKALLIVRHGKQTFCDTVTLSSTNPEAGLQQMIIMKGKTVRVARAYAHDFEIFLCIPFYPGKNLYTFQITDNKLQLLKVANKIDYIFAENGFVINDHVPIHILALDATRGTRDYNAWLYVVSNENSIFGAGKVMLPPDYDDGHLLQSNAIMDTIYNRTF